jgi:hypothetical protein
MISVSESSPEQPGKRARRRTSVAAVPVICRHAPAELTVWIASNPSNTGAPVAGAKPPFWRAVAVVTDEQWAEMELLVEACRPPPNVPPSSLRRTASAIFGGIRTGRSGAHRPRSSGRDGWRPHTLIRWSPRGSGRPPDSRPSGAGTSRDVPLPRLVRPPGHRGGAHGTCDEAGRVQVKVELSDPPKPPAPIHRAGREAVAGD